MDLCAELLDLIQTRRATGRSGKVFENVWGHCTENTLFTLRGLMPEMDARNTLERSDQSDAVESVFAIHDAADVGVRTRWALARR